MTTYNNNTGINPSNNGVGYKFSYVDQIYHVFPIDSATYTLDYEALKKHLKFSQLYHASSLFKNRNYYYTLLLLTYNYLIINSTNTDATPPISDGPFVDTASDSFIESLHPVSNVNDLIAHLSWNHFDFLSAFSQYISSFSLSAPDVEVVDNTLPRIAIDDNIFVNSFELFTPGVSQGALIVSNPLALFSGNSAQNGAPYFSIYQNGLIGSFGNHTTIDSFPFVFVTAGEQKTIAQQIISDELIEAQKVAGITPIDNGNPESSIPIIDVNNPTVIIPDNPTPMPRFPSIQNGSVTGNEDSAIALDLALLATPSDSTGIIASYLLTNIPAGAMLNNAAGDTLSINNNSIVLTPNQLLGLTISPGLDFNGSFELSLSVIENRNGELINSKNSAKITIDVNPVAGIPTVIGGLTNALGDEDTAIALNLPLATPGDAGEAIHYIINGIPTGAVLNNTAGDLLTIINNSITLSAAQIIGLSITPPPDSNSAFNLNIDVRETDTHGAVSTTVSVGNLNVTVNPVPGTPSVAAGFAIGAEDSAISVGAAIQGMVSLGESTETITSYRISNIPVGFVFNNGITVDVNGIATVPHAQLAGLTLTPPANFNGTINLSISAIESDNGVPSPISNSADLTITITPVAAAPSVVAGAASGNEDSAISIGASIQGMFTLGETGETITTYLITNVPAGSVFNNGVTVDVNGDASVSSAQLTGLTITPPANFNGTINLSVSAIESDNGVPSLPSAAADLIVTVTPIAVAPSVVAGAALGNEDSAISLDISIQAMFTLGEGAETITNYIISNIPAGSVFNNGVTADVSGTATVSIAQLSGLTLTPPANFNGTINLSISAAETDNGVLSPFSLNGNLAVTVAPVAGVPIISSGSATGSNLGISLESVLSGMVTLGDPGETITQYTITGIPNGITFNNGVTVNNGTAVISAAQLTGLMIIPPLNFVGEINFSVSVTENDNGAIANSTSANLKLSVEGDHIIDLTGESAVTVTADFVSAQQVVTVDRISPAANLVTYNIPAELQNLQIIGTAFDDTFNVNGIRTNDLSNNIIFNGAGGNDTLSYANDTNSITYNYDSTTGQNTVIDSASGGLFDLFQNFETVVGSNVGGNTFNMKGIAAITLNGGSGLNNTLSYATDPNSITVNLAAGTVAHTSSLLVQDTYLNFQNIIGSQVGGDKFQITTLTDGIKLQGGGPDGTDNTLDFSGAASGATINFLTGNITLEGKSAQISNFHTAIGTGQADTFAGGSGINNFSDGGGSDLIIAGGAGSTNTFTSGAGGDTYKFSNNNLGGNNTIKNYVALSDKLDLNDILHGAISGFNANYIQLNVSLGDTTVKIDPTGSANFDVGSTLVTIEGSVLNATSILNWIF